jgi:hypothetical protein
VSHIGNFGERFVQDLVGKPEGNKLLGRSAMKAMD